MKKSFLLFLVVVFLGSCYPAGPEYVEDLDVVYTTFDKEYDFQAGNTYSMPDQIVVDAEKNINGEWIPEFMAPSFAAPILAQIADNMEANGWTRLPNDVNGELDPAADVVLTPAAITSTTVYYSYWYDWWYGGYYGGWYYPPYYTVSSYTTGSLVMVIADPHAPSPINQTPAVWIGVANGLFTGAYDMERVEKGIDQAFEQSSYLKLN